MSGSILNDTKKTLGMDPSYTAFDTDIMMHVNTSLSTLEQLGVGPAYGYMITGPDETWADFVGDDPRFNSVKSYVYLSVRLVFDPPSTSFTIAAMEKQLEELGWRLSIRPQVSSAPMPTQNPLILDGGDAGVR